MKTTLISASLVLLSLTELVKCQAVYPNQVIPFTQCVTADQNSAQFYAFMNHFTGIFYGNFITNGAHAIFGPLAVGGIATIPSYSVDSQKLADCSSSDATKRLGLYAKTLATPATLRIAGDLNIANTPTFNALINVDPKCKTVHTFDSSNYKFSDIWTSAIQMSSFLATQIPTHVLSTDNEVKEVHHTEDQRFYVFQFGPCRASGCNSAGTLISDATNIFLGDSSWVGPDDGYPVGRMIVFNIAVIAGETITLTTARPSSGASGCRVIYNFYPVDPVTEQLDTSATITVNRLTNNKVEGLVMNLYGPIRDGPEGNFAGQLVAKSYAWINAQQGSDIMFYEDDCYGKFSCWVPTNFTNIYGDVYTTVTTETLTSTSTSRSFIEELETTYSATTTNTITIFSEVDSTEYDTDQEGFVVTELDTVTLTETEERVMTEFSTVTESSNTMTTTTTTITIVTPVTETSHIVFTTNTVTSEETSQVDNTRTLTTTATASTVYDITQSTTTRTITEFATLSAKQNDLY